MDGLNYFVASPNPSIEDTGTTQSSSSSNAITRPDSGIVSISLDSSPTENVRRLLPASTITNVQAHDLVILAGSVEHITSLGTGSFGHVAGHIAGTVCRNPSSIIGAGATFTARRVRVHCKCIKSGCVVTKAARITSSKADAGSSTAGVGSDTVDVGSGMQERLKHMLFEMRVLTHEPLMFHDNIVQFLGITWEDDTHDLKTKWPSIVLEYADAGTLAKAINNNIISQRQRLRLCLDVANGLSALHECGIIHSDVKPQNILLFTNEKLGLVAKVADFGFSLVESGEGGHLSGRTPPWTAPEWREWIPIGRLAKTDVYSFGLLVWAVMTNCKDPFQDTGLGAALDSDTITRLKGSDTKMMQTISSRLQQCVLLGHISETDYTTAWNVLQCTTRKDPQLRDLTRAIEFLNKAIPISDRNAHDDDGTVVGDSCRRAWHECTKGSTPTSSAYIIYLCRHLARTTRISTRELLELQQNNGGRIDEKFFALYCDLADQKMRSRKNMAHRPVDEIWVLPSSASNAPTTNKHINPNLIALELSRFSADGVRRLYPVIQDMVEGSLIKAAEAGSADAALYLAIFYTNVHFNSAKACDYMRRAAELGSSSAMYLCYRFYKAHGIQLPFLDTQLITWFHAGICWGSQVAYEDGKEAMGYPGVIWAGKIFLQLQGSFYGDTPFRAAEAAGPFNIMRDDFATTMDTIRSLNQHIDDFTIAGGNGDKLLHWAAAMHGVPLQEHKGLLKDLLTRGQANPNVRNAKGETPLLVAMRARNLQAVVELLQHEADPSLASDSGQVPLHWLWTFPDYRQGSEEDEKGVKQFAAALSGGSRQNPLYDATDAVADAVATRVNDSWEADRVMRLQAHVFSELPAGTPLHWAVKRRSIATVKALLAVGAKSSTCAYGAKSVAGTSETHLLSAFHLAAAMHDDDILELFVEAEPDVLQELVPCPLAVAIDGNASNGYANGRIERMMRHGASYQTRAKRTFEWFWRKNYCKLGKGFDQNSPDMTGRPCTPLILAVQSGQVDIVEALLNTPFRSSLEIKGGLANWSPLQESIKQRCDEAYFLLRRHGASISSYTNIDEGGVMNNLVLVAEFGHNRLDVAKDLIYAGVSVVAEQPMNKPPLLVAIAGGSFPLARLLLDNGADPNELRGCVCDIHRLDSGAIDVPTTVFGCLLLQFGHHKLLPLIWILDEYMAGRLAKPLQTIVCPKTGFNIFHQLGFCQERGRDDDVIISAFQKLRAAFPDTSLLNGVAIAHESKMLGHLRLTPLYLAVDVCNARLVRKMLDDGADPSADLGGGLTVLQHGRKVLAEFEGYLATAVLPEWLTPADAAEIPEMLTRRKEIVELLERKEIRSIGQPVDLAVMCNKTRRLFIQSSDES